MGLVRNKVGLGVFMGGGWRVKEEHLSKKWVIVYIYYLSYLYISKNVIFNIYLRRFAHAYANATVKCQIAVYKF